VAHAKDKILLAIWFTVYCLVARFLPLWTKITKLIIHSFCLVDDVLH